MPTCCPAAHLRQQLATHTGHRVVSSTKALCTQPPLDLPGKEGRLLSLQLANPSHHLGCGQAWSAASRSLRMDHSTLVVAGENLADTPIGHLGGGRRADSMRGVCVCAGRWERAAGQGTEKMGLLLQPCPPQASEVGFLLAWVLLFLPPPSFPPPFPQSPFLQGALPSGGEKCQRPSVHRRLGPQFSSL